MVEEEFFDVHLHACRVPDANVIGGPEAVGLGLQMAMESLSIGRLAVAASCNGMAEFAFHLGLEHALSREAFGNPIGKHQYVQGHLVDSLVELRASKALTYGCAWRHDEGEVFVDEAATAKLYASEMAGRVIDRMIQVHGGLGWTRDLPLERAYRWVRMYRIVEGTSEIQRWIIAKSLGM
jgi:alkylation response protein AidB-like acyl-CoA dehydrogenase